MTDEGQPAERSPRFARFAKGRIFTASATYDVVIRNVSRFGLGLKCREAQLAEGEDITVELPLVGRVQGTVQWVRNGNCGVRLQQEIDPQSLLFVDNQEVRPKDDPFRVFDRFQPDKSTYRPGFNRR
jgi:hypothetical protein